MHLRGRAGHVVHARQGQDLQRRRLLTTIHTHPLHPSDPSVHGENEIDPPVYTNTAIAIIHCKSKALGDNDSTFSLPRRHASSSNPKTFFSVGFVWRACTMFMRMVESESPLLAHTWIMVEGRRCAVLERFSDPQHFS